MFDVVDTYLMEQDEAFAANDLFNAAVEAYGEDGAVDALMAGAKICPDCGCIYVPDSDPCACAFGLTRKDLDEMMAFLETESDNYLL